MKPIVEINTKGGGKIHREGGRKEGLREEGGGKGGRGRERIGFRNILIQFEQLVINC